MNHIIVIIFISLICPGNQYIQQSENNQCLINVLDCTNIHTPKEHTLETTMSKLPCVSDTYKLLRDRGKYQQNQAGPPPNTTSRHKYHRP